MSRPPPDAAGTAQCAIIRLPLPHEHRVAWTRVVSRVEPRALALASYASQVNCTIDTLERVFDTLIVAADTSAGKPPALWLFGTPEMKLSIPDELEIDASGAYDLADAWKTWSPHGWNSGTALNDAAHRNFMRAVEMHCTTHVAELARAYGAAVPCARGVLRISDGLEPTCLVTCRAHTTQDTLVIQMHEQATCLETVQAAEAGTEVILLPTLVRATVISDAMPSVGLEDALGHLLDALHAPFPRTYVSVRVSLALGELGLDDEIEWPVALCLAEVHEEYTPPKSDIGTLSIAELLRRGTHPVDLSSPPPPPPPREPSPDQDDVFGGIADLTEDDYLFFSAPAPSIELHTPASQSMLLLDTSPKTPNVMQSPAEFVATPRTPVDAPAAERRYSALVPSRYSAVDSATESAINEKYGTHGKYFAAAAPERTCRFDMPTPQTAVSAPTTASSPVSSDSDEEEPRAQQALALVHLHTSLWDWGPPREREKERDSAAVQHALMSRCRCQRTVSTKQCPPAAPLHSVEVPFHQYAPPSVLVGCQAVVVEATCAAPAFWTTLGLEPIYGPKDVDICVVVSGSVNEEVLHEWLHGVTREYTRHRLGAHVVQNIFHVSGSGFIRAGVYTSAHTVWTSRVVYFVHAGSALGYQALLETQPPDGVVVPVPVSHVLPAAIHVPRELALFAMAVYDAVPRDGMRPAYLLSPRNYTNCEWLRARTTFSLEWSFQLKNALHYGRVLHVAYDLSGHVVSIVGMDDRVQFCFSRVIKVKHETEAIGTVWQVITTELHAVNGVDWHVVVCRLGSMPASEARAWSSLEASGPLSLVVASAERGAVSLRLDTPLHDEDIVFDKERRLAAVYPPDAVLLESAEPLLARRSAFVLQCGTTIHDAFSVHVLGVQSLAAVNDTEASMCLADVVHHYCALSSFGALRNVSDDAPFLPWHLALLYNV